MSLPIKISALRAFVTVVDEGTIAAAADKLGRTPAAVSLVLKQLEESLGKALFEGDRKSKLTPLGAFTLEQARRQLHHFDYTLHNIERFARNEMGHLAVASVPSAANRLLPEVIRRFQRQWPNVELEVHEMDSVGVRDALQRREVEIGLVSDSRPGDPETCLLRDQFGVVCSAQNPLSQRRKPIAWQELKNENLIANRLCHLIDDTEFRELLEDARLRVHNTGSLLALAAADVGVTVLPALAVPDNASGIAFVAVQGPVHARYIHMLVNSDAPPLVETWRQLLRDVAGQLQGGGFVPDPGS